MTRVVRAALVGALTVVAAACGASIDPDADAETAPRSSVPAEASVTCDGETTRVNTARARPRPDGIHLRIENTSGRPLGWSADVEGQGGLGAAAAPGRSRHVLDLPPGTLRVACFDERRDDPSEVARVGIEVVDDDCAWVSTALACEEHMTVFVDHVAGARGEEGTPVEAVRRRLAKSDRLRPADRVERAGYRDANSPTRVRLVRGGDVIAVFALDSDGHGGWLLGTTDACTGVGLE